MPSGSSGRATRLAGTPGQVDDVPMTVTSQRPALLDLVRSGLVALLAVVQIVVSVLAGSGALGGTDRGGRQRTTAPRCSPPTGRS